MMEQYEIELIPENYAYPKAPTFTPVSPQPQTQDNSTLGQIRSRYRTWTPEQHEMVSHHIEETQRLASQPFSEEHRTAMADHLRQMGGRSSAEGGLAEQHLRAVGLHVGADVSRARGRAEVLSSIGRHMNESSRAAFNQGDENWEPFAGGLRGDEGHSMWRRRNHEANPQNIESFHNFQRPVGQEGEWLETGHRNPDLPNARSYLHRDTLQSRVTTEEGQRPTEDWHGYRDRIQSERGGYNQAVQSFVENGADMNQQGNADTAARYLRGEVPQEHFGSQDEIEPSLWNQHGRFPNARAEDLIAAAPPPVTIPTAEEDLPEALPVDDDEDVTPRTIQTAQQRQQATQQAVNAQSQRAGKESFNSKGWKVVDNAMGNKDWRKLLGDNFDPEDVLGLVGKSDPSSEVRFTDVGVNFRTSKGYGSFNFEKDRDGQTYIYWGTAFNTGGKVEPGTGKAHRPNMMGPERVGSMVYHALKLGIPYIKTTGGKGGNMNGFEEWVKMGFNAPIPATMRNGQRGTRQVPPEFSSATTLAELYNLPGGAAWWKENGKQVGLTLDLKNLLPTTQRILDSYTRKRERNPEKYEMPWEPSTEWNPAHDLPEDDPGYVEPSWEDFYAECDRQEKANPTPPMTDEQKKAYYDRLVRTCGEEEC